MHVIVRKQLLGIAESVKLAPSPLHVHPKLTNLQPLKKLEDEISSIAKIIAESYEDEELRSTFLDLTLQLWVVLRCSQCSSSANVAPELLSNP